VTWVNTVIQGILLGGLYALFAAGLSLVFGVMRVVNLAHGDLSVLAAFLSLLLVEHAGMSPLVTLVIVVPVMFAVGYALQAGIINFALRTELAPLLATFGLAIVLQNVLQEAFSADSRGLDAGSLETSSIRIGDHIGIGWFPLLTFVTSVLVLLALHLLLTRTQLGRALRATSDDQRTALLIGIDNRRIYNLAMGISMATVAIAGVFLAIRTTFAPSIGSARLIFGFEAVIIGGLGSLWGTLAGGVVLGVAQAVGAQIDAGWGVLTGHLVFLAVLALRPNGLFPRTATA
jgi:branched-chain amino acid transport system permease protein